MKWLTRLLRAIGYLFVGLLLILMTSLGGYAIYVNLKYPDRITVVAERVADPCEEGCDWFRIKSVDNPEYSFARGWLVDAVEGPTFKTNTPPYGDIDEVRAAGNQKGYKAYCLTGKLHRFKQRILIFWSDGDLHEFSVDQIRWGACPGVNPQ